MSALPSIPEFSKQRFAICKSCELFGSVTQICGSCGCFMPAKILIKGVNCPENKWGKYEEPTP